MFFSYLIIIGLNLPWDQEDISDKSNNFKRLAAKNAAENYSNIGY